MRTFRLLLAYDGGAFHGWQRQPTLPSVQGELERALAILERAPVAVVGAGRTDAGVHALGQCASFSLVGDLSAARLFASLRGLLPESITPLVLHETLPDFSARFSASARFYEYRLGRIPCAPLRHLRWELPQAVDPARMRAALEGLRGVTDFRAFCTREGAAKGTICHLRELELIEWELDPGELRLRVGADRFLHNMVRILTGTLVEIGRGRWAPERMAAVAASGDRRLAGPTAPPQGLFLRAVEYPERYRQGAAAADRQD